MTTEQSESNTTIPTVETVESYIALLPGFDPYKDAGDCYFDADAAMLAVDFFHSCITHVEGTMAGKPYILEPHEVAIVANIFGWKRPNNTRRFREGLYFVPRKNSKTTFAAGFVLCVLFIDDEPGMQCYSTASARDQAALLFRLARLMVERKPALASHCKITGHCIESGSRFYRAISAEAGSKHGYNVHVAVNDEIHAHKDPELIDVIETGTAARRQPFILHITTSDFERENSICNAKYDYAVKVRDGVIDDPAFLPIVYEANPQRIRDDDNYWKTEECWYEANPLLGKSIPLDYFQRECLKAQTDPIEENRFKRLHLNIRTEQETRFLSMDEWISCGGKLNFADYRGKQCAGAALDLGATSDLTSLCMLFDRPGGGYDAFWKHWAPEDKARDREKKEQAPYLQWAREGWLTLTPGNTTYYAKVRADINELANHVGIPQLAIDRLFQGAQLAQDLMDDGFEVVQWGQGFMSMSAPTVELKKLIERGDFHHGDNPLMKWQASNVVAKLDAAGNAKPDKAASGNKIDGIVTAVMAVGLASCREKKTSIYDSRDLLTV